MANMKKSGKKKARREAVATALAEIQRQLIEVDRRLEVQSQSLERLDAKLDSLIAGDAGQALRGEGASAEEDDPHPIH